MKVTKDEIIKIKPGKSKNFVVEDGNACNSARVMVQYVKRCCKPDGISDYKTEIDWQQNVVTVTAIASV